MLKSLVIVLLVAIVGSLFSALWFLYRDRGAGRRTAKALTLRIGLAIALFAALLIGFLGGWFETYNQ